jgi:CRP/FNR family transcriptional regulator
MGGNPLVKQTSQSALLSLTDVFQYLSEEELEHLSHQCPDISLAEGQDLEGFGDYYNRGIFVIKVGRIRLIRVGSTSRPLTIVTLPAGSVLSTWYTQGLHVQAIEPCVLLYIDRKELKSLVRKEPEVGLALIEHLAGYVRLLADRLFDVSHKNVSSRLASLLLTLLDSDGVVSRRGYEIPTRYTHEELGTMIGAQRVAVTRAFNFLRKAGALEVEQHRIRVRDTSIMQRIAGEER